MNFKKLFFVFCVFGVFIFLSACGMSANKYYGQLRTDLEQSNFDKSAKLVIDSQESFYGGKNILLFNLDAGLTNHYAQKYDTSKMYFEGAKRNYDDFYTKSISAGALSVLANDLSLPYYGKGFERAHVNVFNALNYILNGQNNEAVVEARQADAFLRASYRQFYKDDGFVRYFMALVYENAGYTNDAYTEYGLALAAYKNSISGVNIPPELIDSYYTSALAVGLNSAAANIKAQYPSARERSIAQGQGEVIILDYNGLSPEKVENVISIAVGNAWAFVSADTVDSADTKDYQTAKDVGFSAFADDYIKVAFPAYKRIPHSISAFRVELPNGQQVNSYLAQDLATIAEKTLKDEVAKIYAKTIAAAVIKYIAAAQAAKAVEEQTNNALLGLLAKKALNVTMAMFARADTRTWVTLPSNILMSRFFMPVGTHEITVYFLNANLNVVKTQKITVQVVDGQKTFVALESLK